MSDFNTKKHYFKLDRRITSLTPNAISAKALKAYIIHCRRINPKKHLNCSIAGFNDVSRLCGMPDKKTYTKAIEELGEKFLIRLRPDVKVGYLKTTAVEILAFPLYNAKTKRFSPDTSLQHEHRTYENGMYLQIPSKIVDLGCLRKFRTETILLLLLLYEKTDITNLYGVDFRFIHVHDSKIPLGCVPTKKDPNLYTVCDMKNWYCSNISIAKHVYSSINEIDSEGLLYFAPALVYQDPNDSDYQYIIKVLQQNEEGKYTLKKPLPGEKVIWIVCPIYCVEADFRRKNNERIFS